MYERGALMKMIKVSWNMSFEGIDKKGIVEVPENATDDQIDAMVKEDAFDGLDWGWIRTSELEKQPTPQDDDE